MMSSNSITPLEKLKHNNFFCKIYEKDSIQDDFEENYFIFATQRDAEDLNNNVLDRLGRYSFEKTTEIVDHKTYADRKSRCFARYAIAPTSNDFFYDND